MKLLDLLITAIALSMDAFAVSIGKGLSVKQLKASHCLITGAYFGGFSGPYAAGSASCWPARSPRTSRNLTTGRLRAARAHRREHAA